ncbi:MAG: 2'-5' RNA ligase family protein [Chitinophagaceae bacterium]
MTDIIRRQLTLFIQKNDGQYIEDIRSKFNPLQSELINSHVTLCREDEIEDIGKILYNLTHLNQKEINVKFGQVAKFDNGKGALIPGTAENEEFQELRQKVLKGVGVKPRRHEPHITLMHPRNSNCTDMIFEAIEKAKLPAQLIFNTISLIEQVNGEHWTVVKTFDLSE